MIRYAQWLDGAYINLALSHLQVSNRESLIRSVISRLKLHALFGHEFALSDIQTIDSPVIHALFNDKLFLSFLQRHPNFLSLVARPVNLENPNRWSIVSMGLQRTQNPVWISSSYSNAEIPKALAGELLKTSEFDVGDWFLDSNSNFNKLVKTWPEHESDMKGTVNCIAHFMKQSTPYSKPRIEKSRTLYDVLLSMKETPNISKIHENYIYKTIGFIDDEIEEDKRGMQSVVFVELDKKISTLNPDYSIIKNTTHNAWNMAVMETVSPDYGSLGYLSSSVHGGIYLNRITDVIIPVKNKNGEAYIPIRQKRGLIRVDWDPSQLDWLRVADVRERTLASALMLQKTLEGDDTYEIREASENHVRAISNSLTEKPRRFLNPWMWILGSIVLLFVNPVLGATFAIGERVVEEGWRTLLYRGRKYLIANTCRKFSEESSRESL